jgi:hypothetical protein
MNTGKLSTAKYYFLAITILTSLNSCKDENIKPPLTLSEFYNCHHETIWNEESTRDSLIGKWDWIYTGRSNFGQNVDDQKISIEFKSDSTLVTEVKDSITQISSWYVVNGDADMYAVEIHPINENLGGRIQFCNDLVVFNFGYLDLIDNYYRKRP